MTPQRQKKAIVCVSFGTANSQNRTVLAAYEGQVQAEFPSWQIRWAFLSKRMRHLSLENGLEPVGSLEQVLRELGQDDYGQIVVQPLQIIPGNEFAKVQSQLRQLEPKLPPYQLAKPLLWGPDSVPRLGQALLDATGVIESRQAVLYMAHGSPRPEHALYVALAYWLSRQHPRQFLGSIKYWPRLEDHLPDLLALKPDQVRLIPLLTLIGAHALEDMAGDDPGSWKGRLAKLGLTPQPEFRGLLDRPRVIELWLQRLRQAWELLHTQAQILGLT